jgi:hypothetical protein
MMDRDSSRELRIMYDIFLRVDSIGELKTAFFEYMRRKVEKFEKTSKICNSLLWFVLTPAGT